MKFHYVFRQKLSVEGFNLKKCKTSVSDFNDDDVLQPSP